MPSIYRIHEMPDPKRIVDFEETASGFGYSLGFGSLPVKRMTMKGDRRDVRRGGGWRAAGEDSMRWRSAIPVTPQMYQRLTAKIAGKPEERILAYLMLRSLKQARYSEKNVGHFALASAELYALHFADSAVSGFDCASAAAGADSERGGYARAAAILSDDPQPWQTSTGSATG